MTDNCPHAVPDEAQAILHADAYGRVPDAGKMRASVAVRSLLNSDRTSDAVSNEPFLQIWCYRSDNRKLMPGFAEHTLRFINGR